MGEGKLFKDCPVCKKEIPAHWSVCEFCGNVFEKTEPGSDAPCMLFWGEGGAKEKRES